MTTSPPRHPRPRRRIVRRAILVAALVLAGLGLDSTSYLASFGARPSGDRLARIQRSPNYRDGTFHNLLPTRPATASATQMLSRQFFGTEQRYPRGPVPIVTLTGRAFDAPPPTGLRVTWMGHATTLLEIDGSRVLFDPIWSDRCSPSTLVGPTRFFPPPLPLGEVPRLDAVVISHDHYDHLDMATIRALAPSGVRFIVGLGIGAHLARFGVPEAQIVELDWGESTSAGALTITSSPARHYSGRGMFDGDTALWSSWILVGPTKRAFMSGDTGFSDAFQKAGDRFGPFDLTLLKIGAYAEEWTEIHINPEEALAAHEALRGKVLVPIHWGTFNLGYHAWNEPPERLLKGAEERHIQVVVPKPGQMVEPAAPPPVERWWFSPG